MGTFSGEATLSFSIFASHQYRDCTRRKEFAHVGEANSILYIYNHFYYAIPPPGKQTVTHEKMWAKIN